MLIVLTHADSVEHHRVKLQALANELVSQAAQLVAKACELQREAEGLKFVENTLREKQP